VTKLRTLDLFSGIGGFSLGLERTGGFETVAFCEIEEFPRRVLAKHWPDVPCYRDVRELTAERLAADGIAVDVICGGFPCQRFSNAARGRNNAPDLWPEYARLSRELLPSYAIAENVKRWPIERAAEHFRSLGLSCFTVHISADEIGADHERSRWWAIAHPHSDCQLQGSINAEMAKLRSIRSRIWGAEAYRTAICISDGLPARLGGSVSAFGNSVVPQIPELIGRAILEAIASERAAA
jgi:DNA (cytosine-5)-methyltransferase 1